MTLGQFGSDPRFKHLAGLVTMKTQRNSLSVNEYIYIYIYTKICRQVYFLWGVEPVLIQNFYSRGGVAMQKNKESSLTYYLLVTGGEETDSCF